MLVIFMMTCTSGLFALSSPDVPPDPPLEDGDSIPLDGGLAVLLVGASAFGIKKLRDQKNGSV
ncbi:PID-CTERM protein-sorting domain-containing protein [Mariniflexile sp. AS56]|uniref:PID-CTERM protein-sorting domain-containing protein n=1 Tax=Mariniflexile sp. AS56 TaxID=3063957 RepID=UPI0026F1279F|nr:hypothetical protein [Mariniflexile sp. AS56]MDO7170807.1 hypothetical protein [Mariniflexile sp. AS56]